jgi:hypothetical protein
LQAFDSEDELLSYYDSLNFTSRSIHAVIFEDLPPGGDPPDHLKYKIRISGIHFFTTELFPEFSWPIFFGKDVRILNKYVTLISFVTVVNTYGVVGKI